jgi:dihydroorotate dehydrogenase (NAD+) catalytic subunit
MAPDPEGFARVASSVEKFGADAVELNVSCPHVKQMGAQIGQDYDLLREVVKKVKSAVSIPVLVKLTPNVTDIVEEGKAAERGGADALVAINTVKAMVIDVNAFKPILTNRFGGLSGPAVKPVALRCVYELFENVDIPVVGVGGIVDWRDAVEFFLAGAMCVQIGTAIAYQGLKTFEEINKGLVDYLESNNYRKVDEIIGLAHQIR